MKTKRRRTVRSVGVTKDDPKMWRPPAYLPEYADRLNRFFDVDIVTVRQRVADGHRRGRYWAPAPIPLLVEFALALDVSLDMLRDWAAESPEFLEALKRARLRQWALFREASAAGLIDPRFVALLELNPVILNWDDTGLPTEVDSLELLLDGHRLDPRLIRAPQVGPAWPRTH